MAAAKLTIGPSDFDKSFVAAEFERVSKGVDISKIDHMHFPSVVSKRWTLISVNPLFSSTNFFDPAGVISEKQQDVLLHNLVCNLNTVCQDMKLRCKNFEKFNTCRTLTYPSNALLHNCGFYVMLYAEIFNGKVMGNFTQSHIPKYMMIKAFALFYSYSNAIEVEPFERDEETLGPATEAK